MLFRASHCSIDYGFHSTVSRFLLFHDSHCSMLPMGTTEQWNSGTKEHSVGTMEQYSACSLESKIPQICK